MTQNYVFQNDAKLINNDSVYDHLFELQNSSYTFLIQPIQTKFWRFGIRFSKTEIVEFYHPDNRYKQPEFNRFKDLHLGVGEWDGSIWSLPNRLHLAQYNIQDPSNHILKYSPKYVEFGEVEWKIRYDENNGLLTTSYTAKGCDPFEMTLGIDREYKYFKLFAWADKSAYKINCDITFLSLNEAVNEPEVIEDDASKKSTSNIEVKSETIQVIQTFLKEQGLFNSYIDGKLGPITRQAIKEFQTKYSLEPSGTWNPITQKKYEELQTRKSNPPKNVITQKNNTDTSIQYWFLKIYGDNWSLQNINENDEGHFNSHFNSYEKRPDYENFRTVKTGDLGVAYDYSSGEKIVFLFTVTQPLHYDEKREEIFSFVVTMKPSDGVELSNFIQNISFAPELDRESVKKLFPLAKDQYDFIFGLLTSDLIISMPNIARVKPSLSEVSSDVISKNIEDQLGFESDVNALASVIAYREIKPPLAIGLFGNWGSGKSFFMSKLQLRIEELKSDTSGAFCKEVVPINFNSWHYSDSNLWASLITKIFEDLEKYGQSREDGDVKKLFENLNSTQELLQDTKNEKARVDKEIGVLKSQKLISESDIQRQSGKLQSLSFKEILTGLMIDTTVQEDFNKLKQEYSFLKLKEYDDIETNFRRLDDFSEKGIQSIKIFFSFMKGKKLFLALLFVILISVGIFALIENSGFFKKYLGDYKAFILMISGSLALFLKFLKPAIKIVNNAFKGLKSLDQSVAMLKEKAKTKFSNEHEKINQKLSDAQAESDEIQKKIELMEVEQKKLEDDINDIISGKKIIRFIESRVTDQRYINSLGIISWIRKDFEELDFLLKQQFNAAKLAESKRKKIENLFEVDRIILYIDDLDRCNETIVVEVLEAIHLLLAFELFVVVVGVDPRWMHNALIKKYPHLASSSVNRSGDNDNKQLSMDNQATSFDYLEKIFQIPFALKQIDHDGRSKLIRSQTEAKKHEESTATKDELDKPAKDVNLTSKQTFSKISEVSSSDTNEGINLLDNNTSQTVAQEENEKEVILSRPESLKISDDEIRFMQEISFLFGDSPRTIKRYINMYRIIRTHNTFDFADQNELEHYFAAMLLLAIITGVPEEAKPFFEKVNSSDKNTEFNSFLNEYSLTNDHPSLEFKKLSENINADKTNTIGLLKAIKMEKFKKNLDLISRFSFRDII